MAKVTYQILDTKLNTIPENETYSSSDMRLIDNFEVNRTYDLDTNFITLFTTTNYPLMLTA